MKSEGELSIEKEVLPMKGEGALIFGLYGEDLLNRVEFLVCLPQSRFFSFLFSFLNTLCVCFYPMYSHTLSSE